MVNFFDTSLYGANPSQSGTLGDAGYSNNQSFDVNSLLGQRFPNQQAGYGIFNNPIPPSTLTSDQLLSQFGINQNSLPAAGLSSTNSNFLSYLNQLNAYNQGINNISQRTAIEQAQAAYLNALIEYQGTKKTLEINNQSTQANAILDQQKLALQQNYNVLNKQTEMYVMDAQQREQYQNLFFNLEFTMAQNAIQLSKTVVQSAKY